MPSEVVVYATRYCAYCLRAKALLDRRGIPYRVVDVTGDDEARAWLVHRTGRWKVPQIFIGDESIGGFAELAELDRAGNLVRRLAGDPDAEVSEGGFTPPQRAGGSSGGQQAPPVKG